MRARIPPSGVPLIGQNGLMTPEWYRYFSQDQADTGELESLALEARVLGDQSQPNPQVLDVVTPPPVPGLGLLDFLTLIQPPIPQAPGPAYEIGSFTATLTGCTTSPTGTVNYERNGNHIVMLIPSITGTSNSTTASLTGIPSSIIPASNNNIFCNVIDTGANFNGMCQIGSGGVIALFKTADLGATVFTNSGVKGVQGNQVVSFTMF